MISGRITLGAIALGFLALVDVVAAAPVDKILRRYVLLAEAVQFTPSAGPPYRDTLVIEWVPSEKTGAALRIEGLRFQHGEVLPNKDCRIEFDETHFSGEVRLPATKERLAGNWRFSGPLSLDGSDGVYEGGQGVETRTGRVRVVPVYDAGKSAEALRAWIPPGPEPIRGVFLWGNGGRNDDRHEIVRDHWLGFCALHRFALVATARYGADMRGADGRMLQRQLTEIFQRAGRPELERAPILFTGHSNGGIKAWEFNALHPERIIAFTVSRAANRSMSAASRVAQSNPAMLVIGENDNAESNAALAQLFLKHRPEGALWALVVEKNGGHPLGRTPHLWLPFFDWAVRTRCVEDASSPNYASLRPVDAAAGWLVVQRGLRAGERSFGSAAEIKAGAADTSWFPNEAVGLAYLGYAGANDPFGLASTTQRGAFTVGETMELRVNPLGAGTWSQVSILINGRPVAHLAPDKNSFAFQLERPGVYVAMVVGRPADGGPARLSRPLSWVVTPR